MPPRPGQPDDPDAPVADFLREPARVVGDLVDRLPGWLPAHGLVAAGLLTVVAVAGLLGRVGWWRWTQARLGTGACLVTVAVPSSVDADGAAGLWANLTGLLRPTWRRLLLGQPHVCFEYAFDAHGLEVRIWVPGCVPTGMVTQAVEAAWPGARTHIRPATDVPPLGCTASETRQLAVGGRLRLARPEALPLRTDFPADPLRALLAAPGPLYDADRVVVQVLARPVTGRRAARHTTTHQKAGVRLPATVLAAVATALFDLLTTRSKPHPYLATSTRTGRPGQPAHQATLADQARDRAIVTKHTGPLYETTIRYATTASGQQHPDAVRSAAVGQRLRGRAHAIAAAFELFAGHNHYRRTRLSRVEQTINRRWLPRGDLLSVAELAALAHLPTDDHVAGLERAAARAVAPPPVVPSQGPRVKPLGDADAGPRRPVGIDIADARQHLHILGATGSGKSELMAGMILADAAAGRGLVAVDPKGDLIVDVLARLPTDAAERVVLFDAGAHTPSPCLNPLDGDGVDAARTVDNLVSVFSRVYADSWGPRTDDILRASLLTLTQQPPTEPVTLLDLPALLSQPVTRDRLTAGVQHDPVLAGFWTWYDRLTEAAQAAVVAPLMNKLRGFLLRPFIRQAIAAGPSTVNLADVLDAGGICLVRIPAGLLGPETANLFGSLIVAQTWQAATARVDRPGHRRPDAGLYLDEAHNFLNLPYALDDMLAQARGYRLSLTLAHQNLTQLPREIADGIAANARTKIYFTTGPDDAARLARHIHPHLSEHDLAHLGAFQVAVRPMVDNRATHAFTATTRQLPPPIPGRSRAIRATAASHHHRPPASETYAAAAQRWPSPVRDPRRR